MVQASASASKKTRGLKTLLVEDQVHFRDYFKKILHEEFPKMLIEEAANRIETLKKVTSFAPDLIFMDIRLPDEEGLELARIIKSQHPHIKIVMLTFFNLPEYRIAALQHGVEAFFIKGLTPWKEIVALVKSISSRAGGITAPVKRTRRKSR